MQLCSTLFLFRDFNPIFERISDTFDRRDQRTKWNQSIDHRKETSIASEMLMLLHLLSKSFSCQSISKRHSTHFRAEKIKEKIACKRPCEPTMTYTHSWKWAVETKTKVETKKRDTKCLSFLSTVLMNQRNCSTTTISSHDGSIIYTWNTFSRSAICSEFHDDSPLSCRLQLLFIVEWSVEEGKKHLSLLRPLQIPMTTHCYSILPPPSKLILLLLFVTQLKSVRRAINPDVLLLHTHTSQFDLYIVEERRVCVSR